MAFIPDRTKEQHQRITANYMPNGKILEAKNIPEKKTYKLLDGLSGTYSRLEAALNDFLKGMDITNSSDFVEEWEDCLRIPDAHYNTLGSREERRRYAVFKLSTEGVVTNDALVWLFGVYGIDVNVYPGKHFWDTYDPRVGNFSSIKEARFTIVFGISFLGSESGIFGTLFPVPFPWVFGNNRLNTALGLMREVIQANINMRYFFEDDEFVQDTTTSLDIWQDTTTSAEIRQDI